MMLQGLCFGEEAGARNLVFFRVKWLQPAMKGTSSVRRVRLRSVCLFFLPHCNGGFKLLWVCLCVRSYRVFWNLCLQIALEWLHDVARALFWGGSRSTKPCVFPCKVAAAGEERYLVCAAGAAAVGLPFFCRIVTVASSCFGCACVCVVIGCFGICACRSHWNGCMMLQGLCFGEEAGARNLVFFRVKWLQPARKGTSSVRRVRLRSVCLFFCRIVTVASSCFGCAYVCVVIGCFGICACRSHWNGCMMLQGLFCS